MDAPVWKFYLRSLLQQHIARPSLLLVNNLECHVSGESEAIGSDELMSVLQPLPKNAPQFAKPLDVATTAKEKRLATIKRVITAWESIEAATITSAFNKALKTNF
ncbi:uncharacterized protein PITG_05791 [Phytophthora infestans T30-4]|uniref:DDE-1 domain-containing protein n=1 Tax=Phytophthora infestans (strain T30-4) TaxID=403677 RepID=D0N5P5_PHYIT|nr:uncharacterized protein PITG_05791 [Phytophthora infestans T30-4]EEY70386.1 hypothetical protein PITG_05791 [Phytophthora infestans T30-4]|eukprot:XP_002998040.1 hypothetical protein PITG_05791 [Phytophthora infestans T30-4]